MGLADIIRAGVAIANTVTSGAQDAVSWSAWTGQDMYGKATYATAQPLQAIIDLQRKTRFLDGREVTVVATLTILEPVTPNGAAGRHEPIDPRDRIVLPDGTTGPIMTAPGAVWDSGASRPFLNEVLIGEPGQLI